MFRVQVSIENCIAVGSYRNWVDPSDVLPGPLQRLARYGLIVYDNGDDTGYMEDLVLVCCCYPACERVFRLDWCQPVASITRRQVYKCHKHLARVHGVRVKSLINNHEPQSCQELSMTHKHYTVQCAMGSYAPNKFSIAIACLGADLAKSMRK